MRVWTEKESKGGEGGEGEMTKGWWGEWDREMMSVGGVAREESMMG